MGDKDRFRLAEDRLRAAGFDLVRNNGHKFWQHPDGRHVTTPSSPGEGRGYLNLAAQLKRLGVPDRVKDHVHVAVPLMQTELVARDATPQPIQARKPLTRGSHGKHQVLPLSVSEVLLAQEVLKGNDVSSFGTRERYVAVGKLAMRWMDAHPSLREEAIAFADSMEPDYETVFAGTFPCRYEGCSDVRLTPMGRGRHEKKHRDRGETILEVT